MTDGCLDRNFKLLTRDNLLEFLNDQLTTFIGKVLVNDKAEGVDSIAIEKDIHFDQFRRTVFRQLIVKARIATSRGFQFIKEIKDNFRKWDLIDDIHPIFIDVIHGHKVPTFPLSQFHHSPYKLLWHHDLCFDIRFFDRSDLGWIWKLRRV